VISFPIKNAFEQYLNALYVERLGYGRACTGFHPPPEIIPEFETRLGHFQENIQTGHFCGNEEIYARVEQFIREKKLDY
jgi:hypothetical protein